MRTLPAPWGAELPYLYGLAAGGEAGVDRAIALLRDEVARSVAARMLGLVAAGEQHLFRAR